MERSGMTEGARPRHRRARLAPSTASRSPSPYGGGLAHRAVCPDHRVRFWTPAFAGVHGGKRGPE
jgi:hypothetical protein